MQNAIEPLQNWQQNGNYPDTHTGSQRLGATKCRERQAAEQLKRPEIENHLLSD